ncbi:MAG: lactoylglutathione lyase [Proteobacteria bacterium]|nr:lactoylglutathione lyase [Pseudomonadota bacterium]
MLNDSSPPAARLLHTMLRVRDLDAMLGFYCGQLGMQEIRRIEFDRQRYSLVFIGYGAQPSGPQVELWHEWDGGRPYERGTAYGHLGIGVQDIHGFCERLQHSGVTLDRAPAPMRPGGRIIALLRDPEGNEIELLGNG